MVRWKNKIKPSVIDDLTDSTDFIPTIRDAAQKPLSADTKMDGVSFYPRLFDCEGTPKDFIYCFYDPRPGWDKDQFARLVWVRDKRYKLYEDGRLFDISGDVLEKKPVLYNHDSYQTRKVRLKLQEVLKAMQKPL